MAIGTGKNFDLITNLMNQRKSGTVVFTLPLPDGSGNAEPVVGCLIGDLSIKLANKWQAILPNIDEVTLASQIIESSGNAIAWLKTTQSAWMGAEPLRISVPFYLFSMNSNSKITDEVNKFRALMGPYRTLDFAVIVHGGYNPKVFEGTWASKGKQTFDDGTKMDDNLDKGLITIKVGNQFTLSKMLLEDLTVDPSAVQVADGNPLYVKVTATFKSSRVLYSKEITDMFVTS
jgi:hypothetical protein